MNLIVQCELIFEVDNWVSKVVGSDKMLRKLFFKQDIWGISINQYKQGDLLDSTVMKPTITAGDVKDCKAIFVADPFLIKYQDIWYVFYEVLPEYDRKGVIAYSYSYDGINWNYGKVVLKTGYHLSYPYVFKVGNKIYMIPEGGAGGDIKLYEAQSFPDEWKPVKKIKPGAFYDSSIFSRVGKWWMMTMGVHPEPNSLYIYYADDLEGEWKSHSLNPIIKNNPYISRPGGRVYQQGNRLIRFTQDCSENYGKLLKAIEITKLTVDSYEEYELDVVISNSDKKGSWNKDGMHHIDIQKDDNNYLVAVDGYYYKQVNKITNKIYRMLKRYTS